MEIVVMRVNKDYDVAMLEMRIIGLRRISCWPLKFPSREMTKIAKHLTGGYPLDACFVDSDGYIHFARLLFNNGKVEYIILMTKIRRSANLLKYARRLQLHGWHLMFRVRPLRRRTRA
jgi:hypothetical protein